MKACPFCRRACLAIYVDGELQHYVCAKCGPIKSEPVEEPGGGVGHSAANEYDWRRGDFFYGPEKSLI